MKKWWQAMKRWWQTWILKRKSKKCMDIAMDICLLGYENVEGVQMYLDEAKDSLYRARFAIDKIIWGESETSEVSTTISNVMASLALAHESNMVLGKQRDALIAEFERVTGDKIEIIMGTGCVLSDLKDNQYVLHGDGETFYFRVTRKP